MIKKERFVLDCSVTMAWILLDSRMTEKADALLTALPHARIYVPSLWSLEVANVLCLAEHQKKLSAVEAAEFKEFLQALPIIIEHDTSRAMGSIYALAKAEQLTVYDACYLELAIRENAKLATFDEALKKAAKRNGVVVF